MSEFPTKLSVDLRSGGFAVEGREEFVKEMWGLLESRLDAVSESNIKHVDKATGDKKPSVGQHRSKGKAQRSGQKLTRIKDLDLSPSNGEVGLLEFHGQCDPKTFYETNTVFVYYLSKLREITVTASHIYTCYEQLALKAPTAFFQSLRDTASERKWIDASDMEDITTSIAGDNFVKSLIGRIGDAG